LVWACFPSLTEYIETGVIFGDFTMTFLYRRIMASRSSRKDATMIGKLVDREISSTPELLNAIDFIESRQGFNIKLYPIQRLIVKCIFAVPVDYKMGMVPMYDVFREKLLRVVTEEECLHILYEEGRANIGDWRDIPARGYNEACVIAGRRGGKAISVDEPIPTLNGFVRNGDIKDGDIVLSPNGTPVTVLYAHAPFQSEVYRVSFDDGTFVLVHPGHLWTTYTEEERRRLNTRLPKTGSTAPGMCRCGCGSVAPTASRTYKARGIVKGQPFKFCCGHRFCIPIKGTVRTTEEIRKTLLTKRGEANHAIPLTNPIYLPERELLVDPYVLGVWLGDGNRNDGGYAGLDREVGKELELKGYKVHDYNNLEHYIKNLVPSLKKLGVFRNKHIPHDYLWSSYDQRLALLQGLMDTDGSCDTTGRCAFVNTNRNLAEGVYQLAASLGLKPYWRENPGVWKGKKCKLQYRIRWTGTLSTFKIARKSNRIRQKVRGWQSWRSIVSVEPAGTKMVRCLTVSDPDGLFLFGKNFNVTHNSEVVAAIGGFKLYLLLNQKNPQEYFGLVNNSHIDFTFLAQDDSGSNRLYEKLREGVNRAPFFNPYQRASSGSSLSFITEADRGKRDITSTIEARSYPCTTNAVRSPSNVFLALDEFAHFRSEKGSTSDEVYGAATPSCANFHHAELLNGQWISKETMANLDPKDYREYQDSLILSISSPWTKVGKMYDLHRLALEKGKDSNIFTMRVSTAEMNPGILPKFLRDEYEKNPLTFRAEYGGQFLDSSESYVTESQIRACTDVQWTEEPIPKPVVATARMNLISFHPSCIGRRYFWGLDLGMQENATAVAIGHLEHRGGKNPIELVYDYIDRMMVGEKFDGPGVPVLPGITKYKGYKVLPIEDIIAWLKALNRVMPCFRGATDQHGGQQLVQNLELSDIHNIELLNITNSINSQMAFALKGYIDNQRCRFPFVPKFMDELRLVEAEFVGNYQIRVQAPEEKGATDDMCDATEEVAYVAQKWLLEEGGLKQDPSGASLAIQEQMTKPAKPLVCMDGISLQELKFLERSRKMQNLLMMSPGTTVVKNPFYHRGRR
jgi:hypothetical protein